MKQSPLSLQLLLQAASTSITPTTTITITTTTTTTTTTPPPAPPPPPPPLLVTTTTNTTIINTTTTTTATIITTTNTTTTTTATTIKLYRCHWGRVRWHRWCPAHTSRAPVPLAGPDCSCLGPAPAQWCCCCSQCLAAGVCKRQSHDLQMSNAHTQWTRIRVAVAQEWS